MKKVINLILLSIIVLISATACANDETTNELDLKTIIEKSNDINAVDMTIDTSAKSRYDNATASVRTILIEENGIFQGYVNLYGSNVQSEVMYIYENYLYTDDNIEEFIIDDLDYTDTVHDVKFDKIYHKFSYEEKKGNKAVYTYKQNNAKYTDFFTGYISFTGSINIEIEITVDLDTETLDSIAISYSYVEQAVDYWNFGYYDITVTMKIKADFKNVFLNIPLAIKDKILAYRQQVASPYFFTIPTTYASGVNVYIIVPSNTTVYYTLDGSIPTKDSLKYDNNTGVKLNERATVKMIAYNRSGYYSEVITGEFIIQPQLSMPIFNKERGIYYGSIEVEIVAPEGAQIYYTLDGTQPTKDTLLYTKPLIINQSVTIKAQAFKDGYISSYINIVDYTIK